MFILWWIVVGLIAGWATGKIMKGSAWVTKQVSPGDVETTWTIRSSSPARSVTGVEDALDRQLEQSRHPKDERETRVVMPVLDYVDRLP